MSRKRDNSPPFPTDERYPPIQASVTHRVGFSEVDPMGIVWFGRYAVFFEQASAALRDRCGLSHADFFRAGIQPPIVRYDVAYLAPSRLDETLTVVARLHGTDAARINMSYQVFGPDGVLRVTAHTVQVFTEGANGLACFVSPSIWRDCLERWRKGEFACLQAITT